MRMSHRGIVVVGWLALQLAACVAEVGDPADAREIEDVFALAQALSNSYVTTYSSFGFPTGTHSSREIRLAIDVDPGPGAARFFAHQVSFVNSGAYIGLQTDAQRPDGSTGKLAIFSIWNATGAHAGDAGSWATNFGGEGVGYSVRIAYDWQAGRSYRLRIAQLATDSWGGYVTDVASDATIFLGSIQAVAGTGRLQGSSTTFTEYYGPDFVQCSDLRLSRVSWSKPTADGGAVVSTTVSNSVGSGVCPATRTSTGTEPTVHMVGWSRMLYVGDSLASETQDTLASVLDATGRASLSVSTFPGMALCDYLDGNPSATPAAMPVDAHLRARVAKEKPNVVALQFWGNGSTPCIKSAGFGSENYYTQYFWNAFSATQEIELGAKDANIPRPKVLWVMQGPEKLAQPPTAGIQSRPERLNGIYKYVANYYLDATSDAGFLVSLAANYNGQAKDRYTWTQYLPCTTQERGTPLCTQPQSYGGVTQLHKDTDAVHFCLGDESTWDKFFTCGRATISPAIVRYGTRVANDAKTLIGL